MTARCCTPRNDQRPQRWPCSADSSRKEGPSPRSLRYADTGVSQSSMKLWRSGIRVCSRASSRTSSRLGAMSSSALPAATGIELLEGVRHRQPPRREQDREVVEHVGRLLLHAPHGLVRRCACSLFGLLANLVAEPCRIGQELCGVAPLGAFGAPFGDGALEHRQRLVRRRRLELPVVEAAALARMAGGTGGLHEREHRVEVAVEPQLANALDVSGGLALVPELAARAAPEVGLAGGARALQ